MAKLTAVERRLRDQVERLDRSLKETQATLKTVAQNRDDETKRANDYHAILTGLLGGLSAIDDGARAQLDDANRLAHERTVNRICGPKPAGKVEA